MRTNGWLKRSSCLAAAALAAAVTAGCASPQGAAGGPATDPELARLASTARKSFDKGSAEQAARLYLRALEMARAADDSIEIGNNAYNLAACLVAMDKHEDALTFLREASREFERMGRDLADILLLEAKAARLAGQADEALALANQVLPSLKKGSTEAYRLQVGILKANIVCDRGDAAGAMAELDKVKQEAAATSDPLLRAEIAGVRARIALIQSQPGAAAQEYDRQVEFYRKAGKHRDMAQALGLAAQAYFDAGILIPAGDRFYRAARSLAAQGDDLAALKMIEPALSVAERSSSKEDLLRIKALFDEISRRVEHTPAGQPEAPKP